jgi:hypothetical protein
MTAIAKLADLPDLATPLEVSRVLRCSPTFVQTECRRGRLSASLVAGRYLISPDAVRSYLQGNAISCQNETEGLTSTGARTGISGKSDGLIVAPSAHARRAQKTAQMLKQRSRNSSSDESEKAPVIQLSDR